MRLLDCLRNWSANYARSPFKRTVCACKDCVSFCKTNPGALVPSDVERIAERLVELRLIEQKADVTRFLRSSRATTVYDVDDEQEAHIRKIVPARDRKGRCVFLDASDRCRIHGMSPFGCAYFDAHMEQPEIDRRRRWAYQQIRSSSQYQSMRQTLQSAEARKAGPS
jgi:Fe-S-cluster containining protein